MLCFLSIENCFAGHSRGPCGPRFEHHWLWPIEHIMHWKQSCQQRLCHKRCARKRASKFLCADSRAMDIVFQENIKKIKHFWNDDALHLEDQIPIQLATKSLCWRSAKLIRKPTDKSKTRFPASAILSKVESCGLIGDGGVGKWRWRSV